RGSGPRCRPAGRRPAASSRAPPVCRGRRCWGPARRTSTEPSESALDGDRRGLAEPANRSVAHHLGHVAEPHQLILAAAERPPREKASERFFLAHGAHPARHALAAGLLSEEARDPKHDLTQVEALVEDDDRARPEAQPGGARRFKG